MYDPCSPTSRLGITAEIFHQKIKSVKDLQGISGLHFHTLCEQGFGPLAQTLDEVEKQFAPYLKNMQWLNFGGGHHLSRGDYEVEALVERIGKIQRKYQLQVYLEPGEAVALGSGVLVSEVLDFVFNQEKLAILDTSASCHMPDTLEMPYRAELFLPKARGAIKGKPILVGEEFSQVQVEGNNIIAGQWGEHSHNYVLGGQTCLAGDVIGQYSFPHSLNIGQRVMFDDMAHYTMVKTTTFNGVGLPALAIWNSKTDKLRMIKEFSYEDFARRLS